MAKSFFEFNNESVEIQDYDLIVAMPLVVAKLKEKYGTHHYRNLMLAVWAHALNYSGVGCINLKLDQYLTNAEVKDLIVLLENIIIDVNSNENKYDQYLLNDLIKRAGVNFKLDSDYPVEILIDSFSKMKVVLTEGSKKKNRANNIYISGASYFSSILPFDEILFAISKKLNCEFSLANDGKSYNSVALAMDIELSHSKGNYDLYVSSVSRINTIQTVNISGYLDELLSGIDGLVIEKEE